MRVQLVLNNGFRFQGKIVEENDSHLILDEVRLGKTTISKSAIVARSELNE